MKTMNIHAGAGRASTMRPALVRARADARIEGLLFETVLQQTYANPGKSPLEVVYTFPLPSQAVFLGLQTQLGQERRTGTILARIEAERTYEEALQDGDTPVMLELADDGLLTANLGNLAPGEQLVVTLRWGQWLQEEQGRIRAVLPTVLAPRFGAPSLQPQQVPEHSIDAQYPLELTLDIVGALAAAPVRCETHRVASQRMEDRVRLTLCDSAALDRDVVFTLQPAPEATLALHGLDSHGGRQQHVALAALRLPMAAQRGGVTLKILVDCSGSMNGDSIASARRALAQVVQRLGAEDHVSYSRFGSTVAHDLATPRCGDEATRQRLAQLVAATDASLGGTEMQAALEAVFALPGKSDGADVLLITDAQVWEVEAMVAAARRSGHRIFAIGVGSAPREGLLRQLAGATGGACEFATPGESLEQAVDRAFGRIRQQPWQDLRCVWDVEPQDASPLASSAFGGDTLLVQARFDQELPRQVRLLGRSADGRSVEIASAAVEPAQEAATLARMLAARRLQDLDDVPAASRLALDYQLLTRHTCCVVVHERAAGEKITDVADLHVVPQMLAGGWGGMGIVAGAASVAAGLTACAPVFDAAFKAMDSGVPMYSRWRSSRDPVRSSPGIRSSKARMAPDVEPPALDVAQLQTLAQRVLDALAAGAPPQSLLEAVDQEGVPGELEAVVSGLKALGITALDAWLVLTLWVKRGSSAGAPHGSEAALQALLSDHTQSRLREALAMLERELGSRLAPASTPSSVPGLSARLQRLLSRRRV
ncbi:VIT and vWA domain-containing protein [Azohydromonas aeria]|uniref:VIT and vWA domain-containing protein n=1 Tax=Azohydromonas aeria TaxID=2590212 RepID=UPI0012FCBDA1|nr:VIT and VWA domain-containing protein [Azohydromonas aeria]